MSSKIQTRRGAVLLWRLGSLEYGEQSAWSRAPEARGMWAFPWPYFDEWYAFHQFTYLLPKRLKSLDRSSWPLAKQWYRIEDGARAGEALSDTDELVFPDPKADRWEPVYAVAQDGARLRLYCDPAYEVERTDWLNKTGRRVLPIRKFWYSGPLYSHIDARGNVGSVGLWDQVDWYRHEASEFGKVLQRIRGDRYWDRDGAGRVLDRRASKDHLEVFIPRGGKITGYTDR